MNVEIIALAGFMRVLTAGFIAGWEGRMINIHPSLLPAYKGLHTHERALADGAKVHGCSVHLVTPELDGGPVLLQAEVPVLAGDTPETLSAARAGAGTPDLSAGAGLAGRPHQAEDTDMTKPLPIIIDTDPGQDDAVAILLALASPEFEVLGITAVAGNVPLALTEVNARKICELAGQARHQGLFRRHPPDGAPAGDGGGSARQDRPRRPRAARPADAAPGPACASTSSSRR